MKKFIATILGVALLVGATYSGWYFYNQKKSHSSSDPSSQSMLTSDADYLVIKEWGVRLTKDPILGVTTYTYQPGSDKSQPTVTLHIAALDSLSKECQMQVANQWTIIRFAPEDPSPLPADFINPNGPVKIKDSKNNLDVLLVKVNDYYYGQGHPQLSCNEMDKTKASAIYNAFVSTFRSIGPAP